MQARARERRQACVARQWRKVDVAAWRAAAMRIPTNPKYVQGLRPGKCGAMEAQLDLVPLGSDPGSGLEEFAHLGSGTPVRRGSDGRLALSDDSGIVFVLIPAGRYWIGATKATDRQARSNEGPRHEVVLDAFLLANDAGGGSPTWLPLRLDPLQELFGRLVVRVLRDKFPLGRPWRGLTGPNRLYALGPSRRGPRWLRSNLVEC
jgi:hypothetical protein